MNALAPAGVNPYIANLLTKARTDYPGLMNQYNPIVTTGSGEGYAETWPANETGALDAKGKPTRPAAFPMDRIGVNVYRPNDFTHRDLIGELLHVDPVARDTSARLMKSFTPAQIERLKQASGDYAMTMREGGRSEEDALRNATDSALRGVVIGQWPEEANRSMGYTKDQQAMIDALTAYMKSGKR
jgi:hypothetical protein